MCLSVGSTKWVIKVIENSVQVEVQSPIELSYMGSVSVSSSSLDLGLPKTGKVIHKLYYKLVQISNNGGKNPQGKTTVVGRSVA